jgi:site-specific recombinase XerD
VLLNAPYRYAKTEIQKLRDSVILHVLYGSWLRVSELLSFEYLTSVICTNLRSFASTFDDRRNNDNNKSESFFIL